MQRTLNVHQRTLTGCSTFSFAIPAKGNKSAARANKIFFIIILIDLGLFIWAEAPSVGIFCPICCYFLTLNL